MAKQTLKQIKERLEELESNYHKQIHDVAESVFNEIVKPYLIKNKYNFIGGMGSWCIRANATGEIKYNIKKDIENTLNIIGVAGYTLGSSMPDFNYTEDAN